MTGAEFIALRVKLNMTQEQLGKAMGVRRETVGRVEQRDIVPGPYALAITALTQATITG